MSIELALGLFGSVMAIVSFVFAVVSWRAQKDAGIAAAALQAFVGLERSLADAPSALRFHGIDPERLDEVGVTPQEFAYLVATFSAGYIYHFGVTPRDTGPAPPGDYYDNLLRTPATRRAWPLVRLMIGPGSYTRMIEATIGAIEERERREGPGRHETRLPDPAQPRGR